MDFNRINIGQCPYCGRGLTSGHNCWQRQAYFEHQDKKRIKECLGAIDAGIAGMLRGLKGN